MRANSGLRDFDTLLSEESCEIQETRFMKVIIPLWTHRRLREKMKAGMKWSAPMSLSLLKIEPHLSKCGGSLRVYSGRQIGFL